MKKGRHNGQPQIIPSFSIPSGPKPPGRQSSYCFIHVITLAETILAVSTASEPRLRTKR